MPDMFGRGLAFLKEQQEKSGGRFGDRMNKLWLKNGEKARFWFVQDHEDIAVPLVHMIKAFKKNGETYNKDVLCGRLSLMEDPGVCPLCLEGAKGPWPRYVAMVWTDIIVHPTRNDAAGWTPVKTQGSSDTFYLETVKDYRLLIMRDRISGQIQDYLAGDPMSPDAPRPMTILDRAWKLSASGEGGSKTEVLSPDQPGVTPEVAEARQSAPNLEKILIAEFGTSPRTATVAGGSGLIHDEGADVVDYDDAPRDDEDEINF